MRSRGVLAIDVGTSSIRAYVFGYDGELLASRTAPTLTVRAAAGAAHLDARQCWLLVRDMIGSVSRNHVIDAVGVAAQLGLVVVDADMQPLTPVMVWSDRTAQPYVEEVEAALSGFQRPPLGRRITAELAAPRLRMLADRKPQVMDRAHAVLSLKDYLVARLTGSLLTDPAHASYTLLYDVPKRCWNNQSCDALGVSPSILPEVAPASAAAGEVRDELTDVLGWRHPVTVAVGGPDGTVGAIGAGAVTKGRTADIAGTTDVIVHVVDRPLIDDNNTISTNAHAVDGLWTVGGPTGMTGGALEWLARLFGHDDVNQFYDTIGSPAPSNRGSSGVLADPALTGHRYPFWDLRGGRLEGLAAATTASDVVAAMAEGAAFVVASGLRELQRLGEKPKSVTVVGGVARRAENLQLRANAWGLPIEGISDGLATGRGAALLAATAASLFPSVGEACTAMVKPGTRVEPNPAESALLAERFSLWRRAFFGAA